MILGLNGQLGEAAEGKAKAAKDATDDTVGKIKKTLVNAKNNTKLQQSWIDIQNGLHCCGALTMKRAADAAENEDEYDYADEMGKDNKKSTALLLYIVFLFIFMIMQVVFAAMILGLNGQLGEAAEGKAKAAKDATDDTG